MKEQSLAPQLDLMSAEQWKGLFICLLYAGTSTAISMVNKLILSEFKFGGTFLLLAAQLFGALLFMWAFKLLRSLGCEGVPDVPDMDLKKFRRSLLASVLFVCNVGCAFIGLRVVDVPMFLCVRRVTTVCVLVTEYFMLKKMAGNNVLGAVSVIMLGTIMAGYQSLSANFFGYAFVMGNNILTAVLYTEQKKLCDETGLRSFGLLYYNAATALPLSLGIAFMRGEIDDLLVFPHATNPEWLFWMAVSSLLGVLMTYSTVLCNSYNSPLATSITGNTKDIVSTLIGWALFGGFTATFWSVSGITVSFIGSGWYSYIKLMEGSKRAQAVLPTHTHSPPSRRSSPSPSPSPSASPAAARPVVQQRVSHVQCSHSTGPRSE